MIKPEDVPLPTCECGDTPMIGASRYTATCPSCGHQWMFLGTEPIYAATLTDAEAVKVFGRELP